MAKFGEGDPRWLVQDRKDGTNVNNWHWVEKDCLEWSQQRLQHLFKDMVILDGSDGLVFKITGLDSCTGDCIVNNRKNKIIPAYELEIKFKWTGEVKDGSGAVVGSAAGSVHLPYVADENHDEEPEVKVGCELADNVSQRLKEAFLSKGKKAFLAALNAFVAELRAGGPMRQGASASETAAASTSEPQASSKPKLSSAPVASTSSAGATAKSSSSSKSRSSLSITEKFHARPRDLFECFVVEGRIRAFTQSNASVEPRPGGKFTWFGGSVLGEFVELVEHSRIVMRWKFNTWEDDCFSTVTLSLQEPEEGTTILELQQTGIPEADKFGNEDVLDNTERGWRGQVLQRIRAVFGFGI